MTSDKSAANGSECVGLDARLDAIDRLLTGVIPRDDRLAIVGELNGRVRGAIEKALAAGTLPVGPLHPADDIDGCVPDYAGEWRLARGVTRRPRSKIAVASGILGIAAFALLMGTPVVYMGIGMLGEILEETVVYLGLGAYVLAVLVCGGGAMALSVTALWRLWRRTPGLSGHGWALTGLFAGPIPFALASLIALQLGVPLLESVGVTFGTANDTPAIAAAPTELEQTSEQVQQASGYQPSQGSPASPSLASQMPRACPVIQGDCMIVFPAADPATVLQTPTAVPQNTPSQPPSLEAQNAPTPDGPVSPPGPEASKPSS